MNAELADHSSARPSQEILPTFDFQPASGGEPLYDFRRSSPDTSAASHNAAHDPAASSTPNATSTPDVSEFGANSTDDEAVEFLENAGSQEMGGEGDGAPELSASSDYSLVDEDGGGSATQVWVNAKFPFESVYTPIQICSIST